MEKSKKPYADKAWLKNQYVKMQKSACKIAREVTCNSSTIYFRLRYFNIPVRDLSEAALLNSNHVVLSGEAVEFLNGELLGDGHLGTLNEFSACFMRSSSDKSYLKWMSKRLASFGIEQVGRINRQITRFPGSEKDYAGFNYSSKKYVELKSLHGKWYRRAREDEKYKTGRQRRYIKIVPLDLELTPLTCLMWHLGDGCVNNRGVAGVDLSTQGFEILEIDMLRGLLGKLGFKTTRHKDKSIHIWAESAKDFLNYIGDCPVKCYEYRWKIRKRIALLKKQKEE